MKLKCLKLKRVTENSAIGCKLNGTPLYKHNRIGLQSWNKLIFVAVYHSIFIGFTISISYFQVFYIFFILFSLYFQVLSSFCIFRVYFSSVLYRFYFFLIVNFLSISLNIFRFLYFSHFEVFTTFSIFSSFLHFLNFSCFIFSVSYLFLTVFCLENFLSTSLDWKAEKWVFHTSIVKGLMIFVVRYLPEWMGIVT